ncbi:MAG: helix-turn-helix domain containing protein [Rhodobacteraceae bacterium]|nr:helix-turn-helix domain containing protein [Paracoccaceae bacterium]
MENTIDSTIADLRHTFGASTDAELARKLRIDKSTISSWRSRGRVPGRFINLIGAASAKPLFEPPAVWGELQEYANAAALLRFTLLRSELANSGDADQALQVFRDIKPFWLILHRAAWEIRAKVEKLEIGIEAAQAILMHEDISDPKAAAARIQQQLDEDLADNPWLDDYLKPETG